MSAVVTTIAGAVVSLVEVTWDATVAAVTYLDHIVHEALAVGAQLVSRAVTTLVAVGKVFMAALQALLAELEKLVTALLETITQPISNAMSAYAQSVESAVAHAQNDTTANGSLAPNDARAVWAAQSGSVFLFALGVGAVVVTALAVLSSIDIGPSFVVDILVSLLIGTLTSLAIQALVNTVGSAFSTLGSSSIFALKGFFNGSVGSQVADGSGVSTLQAAAAQTSPRGRRRRFSLELSSKSRLVFRFRCTNCSSQASRALSLRGQSRWHWT